MLQELLLFRFRAPTRAFVALFCFCIISSAEAAGLKKVLVLDFINIDKKGDYNYLEASLTDAVRNSLKERFAFEETPERRWQQVAADNYIFRQDFHTQTAATNLGLLARQDIVIAGGFTVREKKNETLILTTVRLVDIGKRSTIAEFTLPAKADSTIFESVDKIAQRITQEAQTVLPSKEDWQKSGITGGSSGPLFENFSLGVRAGGGYYAVGIGDRLEAQLPAVSLVLQAHTPALFDRLAVQAAFTYLRERPKPGKNPALEGIDATANTVFTGGFFLLEFSPAVNIALYPKLGGGYAVQSFSTRGALSESVSLGFAYAAAGMDFAYALSRQVRLVCSLETQAQFNASGVSLLGLGQVGVGYLF